MGFWIPLLIFHSSIRCSKNHSKITMRTNNDHHLETRNDVWMGNPQIRYSIRKMHEPKANGINKMKKIKNILICALSTIFSVWRMYVKPDAWIGMRICEMKIVSCINVDGTPERWKIWTKNRMVKSVKLKYSTMTPHRHWVVSLSFSRISGNTSSDWWIRNYLKDFQHLEHEQQPEYNKQSKWERALDRHWD